MLRRLALAPDLAFHPEALAREGFGAGKKLGNGDEYHVVNQIRAALAARLAIRGVRPACGVPAV